MILEDSQQHLTERPLTEYLPHYYHIITTPYRKVFRMLPDYHRPMDNCRSDTNPLFVASGLHGIFHSCNRPMTDGLASCSKDAVTLDSVVTSWNQQPEIKKPTSAAHSCSMLCPHGQRGSQMISYDRMRERSRVGVIYHAVLRECDWF